MEDWVEVAEGDDVDVGVEVDVDVEVEGGVEVKPLWLLHAVSGTIASIIINASSIKILFMIFSPKSPSKPNISQTFYFCTSYIFHI